MLKNIVETCMFEQNLSTKCIFIRYKNIRVEKKQWINQVFKKIALKLSIV